MKLILVLRLATSTAASRASGSQEFHAANSPAVGPESVSVSAKTPPNTCIEEGPAGGLHLLHFIAGSNCEHVQNRGNAVANKLYAGGVNSIDLFGEKASRLSVATDLLYHDPKEVSFHIPR